MELNALCEFSDNHDQDNNISLQIITNYIVFLKTLLLFARYAAYFDYTLNIERWVNLKDTRLIQIKFPMELFCKFQECWISRRFSYLAIFLLAQSRDIEN